MAIANAVNATQSGFQSLTTGGVWNGRTLTAGTGISISNGDGISGNPTISASGGGASGLSTVYLYEDFLGAATVATAGAVGNTNMTCSRSSATCTQAGTAANPGILEIDTTNGTSAYALLQDPDWDIQYGAGQITLEWVCKIPTLSDGTNSFTVRIGSFNALNATAPTSGAWFEYTHSVNSGAWTIKTANGSTSTSNTASTVDTNWHNYKIIVNAANTSISFYIDGVEVTNSPKTTNLPTARVAARSLLISRQAGQGGIIQVDLCILQIDLTTPRPG